MRILNLMGKALVVAALVPLLVGGCELEKEVRTLRIQNRAQGDRLITLDGQIEALRERNRSLEGTIKGFDVLMGAKNDQIQTLKDQNAALRSDVTKKDADIRELIAQLANLKTGSDSRLPEKIAIELEALQRAYPQLFMFDRATGQLRFSADLTFDFASAMVNAKAREALTKLAAILSQEEAKPIRISIVGHTDNVPVKKPETVRIHQNNQGLSEHRAEAVRDVLVAAAIEASRISTSGLGASKPIADNRTQESRARNRRVEIFLTMGP